MTTYVAQTRRNPDAQWRHVASGYPTLQETARSYTLGDLMIRAGLRYSELHAHRDDLVAGHVLTAEDGTQFRIIESPEPVVPARTNKAAAELAMAMHDGLVALLQNLDFDTKAVGIAYGAKVDLEAAFDAFSTAILAVHYRATADTYTES